MHVMVVLMCGLPPKLPMFYLLSEQNVKIIKSLRSSVKKPLGLLINICHNSVIPIIEAELQSVLAKWTTNWFVFYRWKEAKCLVLHKESPFIHSEKVQRCVIRVPFVKGMCFVYFLLRYISLLCGLDFKKLADCTFPFLYALFLSFFIGLKPHCVLTNNACQLRSGGFNHEISHGNSQRKQYSILER